MYQSYAEIERLEEAHYDNLFNEWMRGRERDDEEEKETRTRYDFICIFSDGTREVTDNTYRKDIILKWVAEEVDDYAKSQGIVGYGWIEVEEEIED